MTDSDRLAKIEKNVAIYATELRLHTEQDDRNFSALSARLEDISSKLDDLRFSMATNNGALDQQRRQSQVQGAIWGGSIAAFISAIGIALGAYFKV